MLYLTAQYSEGFFIGSVPHSCKYRYKRYRIRRDKHAYTPSKRKLAEHPVADKYTHEHNETLHKGKHGVAIGFSRALIDLNKQISEGKDNNERKHRLDSAEAVKLTRK